MSDVNLGYQGIFGFLFLLNIVSVFTIGFIPSFYIALLCFIRMKIQRSLSIVIAILVGSLVSYLFYFRILTFLSSIKLHNELLEWIFLPLLVSLEIVIVLSHVFLYRKLSRRDLLRKKKTRRN